MKKRKFKQFSGHPKNGPVKIVVPKIPSDLPPKLGIALHGDNIVNYAAQRYIGSLPHPLKCSKCEYIATSVKDSKQHWFDSH